MGLFVLVSSNLSLSLENRDRWRTETATPASPGRNDVVGYPSPGPVSYLKCTLHFATVYSSGADLRILQGGGVHGRNSSGGGQFYTDKFEWLFNTTLTAEVISWRGRPDNVVAVGFDPKNFSSAGRALQDG